MGKKRIATVIVKLAEWTAKNRVDSVSPWGHYQPKETKEIREYFKVKRREM